MDGERLKGVMRACFEAQVMNHGDYSLVYGQLSGSGPALVLGYRHSPLELVMCPMDERFLAGLNGAGHGGVASSAAPITSVGLTNVATVADTGTAYEVESVTGFRTCFEVVGVPRISAGAASAGTVCAGLGHGTAVLDQRQDAEDFHRFMGHFMDTLDAFYRVPDTVDFPGTLVSQ
ncbi:hypothetical protein F7P69_24110 [Cellulosimicrobium funkei]|nr:hypothetical protein [Cellulosimicrobium funkei]